PWRELPRKTRDWILFTDEQPTAPVYAGFTPAETRAALRSRMEPSYQGTFTGARRYVLHTFATTRSELMKKRVALSVTFAGHDIGALSAMPLADLARVLEPAASGFFSKATDATVLTPAA